MSRLRLFARNTAVAAGLALLLSPLVAAPARATFSIVACDSVTQEIGVAVQSKYFSVGTAVPWARAGVGAVATQANVNVSLGPKALALLATGMSAPEVLKALAATDSSWDGRQIAIVDARGGAVSWTGKRALDWAGGETGPGFACQGNILAGPAVVTGMVKAYRETTGELAERMIAALEAAQAAGGDKRGQQSASILIVRPSAGNPEYNDRYVDLRVEDHKTPIKELRRVWQIFQGFHLATAHLNYASAYESAGRKDLADLERHRVGEILERALTRGEKDTSVLNGLAWACATNSIFLPQALTAADRAVAAEPRNVDILDTLAEVHHRMGNSVKAIEVGSRAVTIDPKSQNLQDQLTKYRGGR